MIEVAEKNRRFWWLLAPTGFLYGITFVIPLALLVGLSFARFEDSITTHGFYLDNYAKILTDGTTLLIFWKTILLSVYITVSCFVIGYPFAICMRNTSPRMQLMLMFIIVSPLLTSIVVRNTAWVLILGRSGVINDVLRGSGIIDKPLHLMYNEFGVILGVVHVYLSFMVLPIFASLQAIPRSVEEGAASLGASPFRVFRDITFALSLPGVMAGCTLVFILSMGVYVTPVIMGGNFVLTLPMLIADSVRNLYNWPAASAMAFMLLVAVLIMVIVSVRLQGRTRGN